MSKFNELLHRARYITKNDGFIELIRRSFVYFIFECGIYYVYKHHIDDWDESQLTIISPNVECEIVQTNEQANQLRQRYFDFREVIFNARDTLEKGGVAVVLYVGQDVAHISWLAFNEAAKKSLRCHNYVVDFFRNEACTGGTFTSPKYRRRNLMQYGNYKKFQYLKSKGVTTLRHAIKYDNIASIKGYSKFESVLYARARYLRFLNFQCWRETPLPVS